ncbi:hypothetical protein NIIDMKKI_41730 [Mycobacterium kansasii]|uniref:Uncharacterized protein n=1 Tax=Mycobacterium kansasii TaxID=1768 RepID=A0A7G1IDF2_MYCKA|nr:hypothetical protein NIIDMKKI_41730 [Mycobacterium kansasii]
MRDDVPSDVLQCYLDLVLDGLVARLASGEDPSGSPPYWTWWKIRCAAADLDRAASCHGEIRIRPWCYVRAGRAR